MRQRKSKPDEGEEQALGGSSQDREVVLAAMEEAIQRQEAIDELFAMTNLYPRTTGLPMVIWVGPSYGVGHDVRIKVSQQHGQRMDPGNLAVVALRPRVRVVAGELSSADLNAVRKWIRLNEAAIMDHWNEEIDGTELGQRLRPLPA